MTVGLKEIKLNEEQKKAVLHKKGPLLIIAGAGTGKTTVITERIKHLISKEIASPSEILALTFTEKAAREMETRVDVAMPYGYTQMWISTFHAFCDRLLRNEALQIGLDPRYRLMTTSETIQFIRNRLFEFDLEYFRPLGNPTKFISGLLQHFSRLQDEDISPEEYLKWARNLKQKENNNEDKQINLKWMELAHAYRKYSELKVKEGKMDYGDLIVNVLLLFRKRKNVLAEYRKKFKHVLVDEFQDTNIAQYQLIKLLSPPRVDANLTVVGDDSQSIYKFRGAAISNIIHFRDDYKNAKTVVLTKNYRSTQVILDSAYKLIQHNNPDTLEKRLGIDKNLKSMVDKGGEIVGFIHKDRVESEAQAVAEKIRHLVSDKKYQYKDFAVLVRANSHFDPFSKAFARVGVPYQFLGPGKLFRQQEVVELISYLKVLYNYEDSVAFYKILSNDFFEIPSRDIVVILNFTRKNNTSLFEACERIIKNPMEAPKVSGDGLIKVTKLVNIIHDHFNLINKSTAGELLYDFMEKTGMIPQLVNPDTPQAEKKAVNISKFFDKLKTHEVDNPEANLYETMDWIELASELGESPLSTDFDWTDTNAVNILTVHSSKGLEFPVVFLVNLVSQRFPTIERSEQIPIPDELIKEVLPEGDYHMQEERRLFYVGITRAKSELYLTAANYYGEGKREKKISNFVFEALGDNAQKSEEVLTEQLSFLDYSKKLKGKESESITKRHVDYLSFSQINTFQICPLHYKLSYILGVPTPPNSAISYGTSIHEAMRYLMQNPLLERKAFSQKTISDALRMHWKKEGYVNKKHEDKSFEKAIVQIEAYFNSFKAYANTYLLEKSFVVPLPPKDGEEPLKIGGKIDRIDVFSNGDIEIIDYKTGEKIPSQSEVDKNLQLGFYAIAASRLNEYPFGISPKKIKLSLYYFEEQKKITTFRTRSQIKNDIDSIYEWRKKIEDSDFRCSRGYLCTEKICEYSLFCKEE